MKFANAKGGLTSAQKYLVLSAMALLFASASCKINKDANCLNPKAGCYNKDTEQPRVEKTEPPSTETNPAAGNQPSVSQIDITFTEPMKNANEKNNYSVTPPAATIGSVSQLSDRVYRVTFSNPPVGVSQVVLNIAPLTDLSGNPINGVLITVPLAPIQATHTFVSTQVGAYQTTSLTWKNGNLVSVDYTVKKGGTNCATAAALTGTNVSGTSLAANAQITTILDRLQFTDQTTTKVWVCQVNAGQGIDVQLSIDISRDDTSPTSSAVTSNAAPLAFPAAITLSCTDNADTIAYTTDGVTNPDFTPPAVSVGTAYATGAGVTLSVPAALAERTRTIRYLCLDKAGNKEASVKSTAYNAELQWADSGGKSEKWDWAYWK